MFSNIFIPIFLFGMLVFIHELGHFTVAKLCNVFVERFAIGFGPAILKKKFGETEYALCAFPLGGYVKMRGEEEPTNEEEKKIAANDPRSFAAQNVWKRIAIVIMGPTSNFILPIILFSILFFIGMPSPSSKIGSVIPGSVAEQAGLLSGDKILKVQFQDVHSWTQLNKLIQGRANMDTELLVERDGKTFSVHVTPNLADDMNEYGEKVQAGKIGLDMVAYKPVIGVSNLTSDAYVSGLRTGDTITMINDVGVKYWWQVQKEFEKEGIKNITFERDEKIQTITLSNKSTQLAESGIENGELFINEVVEKSIAAEIGLKKGDKLNSINGKKINSWFDFRDAIQKNNGENMQLTFIRDGKETSADLIPQEVIQKNEMTHDKKKVRQLGVKSESTNFPIDLYTERYTNPVMAVAHGFSETIHLTKQTFVGLGKLVTGKLSVNSLGGPISIFSMASTSYEAGGWAAFFRLMALLSITLAALNILPIPVLDGGHLFFFLIEAAKGSPVHEKVQHIAMQVGFYLLMGLMALTFYVDINRFFVDKIKALFN